MKKRIYKAQYGQNSNDWFGTKRDAAGNTNITFNWERLGKALDRRIVQPLSKFLDERNPSSPNYIGNITETQREVNQQARDRQIRIANGEEKPTIADAFFNGLSDGFGVGIWSQSPVKSKTLHGYHHSRFSTKANLEAAKGKKKALDYLLSDNYMAENIGDNLYPQWIRTVTEHRNSQIEDLMRQKVYTFPLPGRTGGVHTSRVPLFESVTWLPKTVREWRTPELIWVNSSKKWMPKIQEAATHEFFHAASQEGRNLNNAQRSLFYHRWKPKDNLIVDFRLKYPMDKAEKEMQRWIDYMDTDEIWARAMTDKAYGGNLDTWNGKQLIETFGKDKAEAIMDLEGRKASKYFEDDGGIYL